jgi:hypothetical protein
MCMTSNSYNLIEALKNLVQFASSYKVIHLQPTNPSCAPLASNSRDKLFPFFSSMHGIISNSTLGYILPKSKSMSTQSWISHICPNKLKLPHKFKNCGFKRLDGLGIFITWLKFFGQSKLNCCHSWK